MTTVNKRPYRSESRQAQLQKTKKRILDAAKTLFASKGFDKVTIEEIAQNAQISVPSIYALYQSKRGVLFALMDASFSQEEFEVLVKEVKKEENPKKFFEITAHIARKMYDAEKEELSFLRGISSVDPVLKELEYERENRRYERQKKAVAMIEKSFTPDLSVSQVQDLLWAFTGRDFYRMLVIDRGWSSDDYEKWLATFLTQTLLKKECCY